MNRLTPVQTLAYSLGQLASGLYIAFNNFTLPLYLSTFTSNAILIGWLSSTRSFEQCLIQPLIGAASDRTWTRVGRRAPFFLATMPLVALLLVVNSWVPRNPDFLILAVAIIFLFSLLYNIGIDPYYALLIDVTPAPQRGVVNGIAQFIGFGGNIVLLVVAALLWESHPEWVFYFVAAGVAICFGLVALGVRERRDSFHAPPALVNTEAAEEFMARLAREGVVGQWLAGLLAAHPRAMKLLGVTFLLEKLDVVRRTLAGLFAAHPEAMKLLGVKFLFEFGISAALPFLTLFVVQEIGLNGWPDIIAALPVLASIGLDKIDAAGLSQLVAAFLLLTTMIAALPSGVLGDRFGKKKVFAAGLLVMGVFGLLAAFATTVPQLLFFLLFLGLGNGARIVLYQPFLGDLIPSSRAGTFMGLSAFTETGGVFLAIFIAGELINLNIFGLHYRTVFLLTGIFVLLGFAATAFVKGKLSEDDMKLGGIPQPLPAETLA